MARAYDSDVLLDEAGNVLCNALGTLYVDAGATTPVSDAFNAASGGASVTTVTTDSSGRWKVWFTTPKSYWIRWSDNGNTAYAANRPGTLLDWATFTSAEHQAFQPAADESSDDTAFDTRLDALEAAPSTLSGTYAQMQAVASPVLGDRWIATDLFNEVFVFNGTMWKLARLAPHVYAPIEFGADPLGADDSRQAFVDCFAAAAAAQASGVPSGDGNLYGEVRITGGSYTISSEIQLPSDSALRIIGETGQGSAYSKSPAINFQSGGFFKAFGGSLNPNIQNLFIYGAPAFKCGPNPFGDEGGPGFFKNVYFRAASSYTGGAVEINNAFYATFIECGFRAASGPGVYINTGDPQQYALGWMYRFLFCQFDLGTDAILWETTGTVPDSTGLGCMFQHCLTENLSSGAAFLHIKNTHATNSHVFWPITVDTVDMADAAGPTSIVHLEATGTGALTLIGLSVKHCSGQNSILKTTGAASANIIPNRFIYEGIAGGTPLDMNAAATGGYGAMSLGDGGAWEYKAFTNASLNSQVIRAGYLNDAYPFRWYTRADGTTYRGTGSGAPAVYDGGGIGSPEGVVTSAVGGIYRRFDGGAGTSFYVKESGAGNTGWVAK